MKSNRIYSFLGILIVLTLFCGNAWGRDVTYTFTSSSWTAEDDYGTTANWTSGKAGSGFSNNGIQVTTTSTGANGTSPVEFPNVSKIVVTYNTNKNAGAGNIGFKVGTNTEATVSWGYSGSDDGRKANFTCTKSYATPQSGAVKITANTTTNSIYIVSVTITYAPPAYTVTFDAEGGKFDDDSEFTRTSPSYQIDESSSEAGITLPSASASDLCQNYGWEFAGWATSTCTETSTAPRLYLVGEAYYPTKNETLYAVYRREDDEGETSTATFTASDISNLTILAKNKSTSWWWLHTASGVEFYIDDYGIYDSSFDIDDREGYGWAILDAHRRIKQVVFTAKTESDVLDDISAYDGGESNLVTDGATQTVTCTGNVTQLMMVAPSSGESKISTFAVTYYNTTFNSEPGCCDEDPVIGGTAQLKAGGTYSLTRVDVECTSATVQDNCEWKDYGFIWSESKNAVGTLVLNADGTMPDGVNKVQVGTSGDASSFNGSLEKSSFETGHTYYYRAYVKNCYYDGSYVYSNTSTLASFTPYTISYNNNGESGTIDTKVVNTGGSVTLSDGTGFTKDHYHIDHWALNSAEGASHAKGSTYSSITANATFYAIWAINTHTFIWSFNGGSSSETAGEDYTDDNDEMEYGATITYPSSSSMSKTGYTFTGWSTTTTTMPDEDLDISANWSAVNYDVTYHLNGGTGVLDRTYTIETATFSLATPTKEGYQFAGWYANSDLSTGGVQTQITVGSTGDKEYWAKWTANTYKVQFNANGGTGSMSDQNFTYDAPKKALSANTFTPATGKYFAGWSTTSSGDVEYTDKQSVNNLTTTNSATVKLYAVWADHTYTNYRTNCVERYDITLDDGEVATTYNGSAKVKENGTTLVKLVAPTKTGYTLTGYYTTKSDGVLIADKDGNLKENVTVSTDDWTDGDGKWVLGDGATFYAYWSAKTYTITLDAVGGSSGSESVTLTYKFGSHDGITNPTKTGYDFGGWYSGVGGTGTLVINTSGTLQNSVTIETIGWTDASGNWILDGTATLYAKWTVKTTTVSFNTNSGTGATSDKTATYDAAMPTPITVPTRSGYYFGGYYDGEGGTGTQYYTAAGASARSWDKDDASLTLYARWYGDLKAWCDPNVTVTGDVHLTSTKDVYVHSTSGAGNLISIRSSDMGSATKMEVAYLDENEDEVDKADSPFRLYNSTASSTIDEEDLEYGWDVNYSLRYTPTDYSQLHNYKLQLTFKRGDKVLKTVTHDINGRSLPEEFVIAVKNTNDSKWYALPSNLARTAELQSALALNPSLEIELDQTGTPTKATIAPSTRIYKATGRNNAAQNITGIRFTNDGDHWLQSGKSNTKLWLSDSNSDNNQVFYLKSTDFGAYELAFDPSQESTRKIGVYLTSGTETLGHPATGSAHSTIYLLPVETKIDELEATATDWTQHDVLVEANASSVSATKVLGVLGATTSDKETLADPVADDTYLLKLDGDLDYTNKNGQTLQFKWYDSSDKLKAYSWVTVPSIIAAGSNDKWSDFASAPTLSDIVVLSKPMTIDVPDAKAKEVVIKGSGSLSVGAGKALVIAEGIHKFDGSVFIPTTESDINIGSTLAEGTGALVVHGDDGTNKATVNFAVKAKKDGSGHWINQFIGTPFNDENAVLYNYYETQLYEFKADGSGTTTSEWTKLKGSDSMEPFMGYNLLRSKTDNHVLWMQGTLNATNTPVEKHLYYNGSSKTENMLANGWVAPIHIDAFEEDDFGGAEAAIYIFNAGTPEDQGSHSTSDGSASNNSPGQYIALPVASTPWVSPTVTVIPAMQAFSVFATGADQTLTLDYDKLVYTPAQTNVGVVPTRAPRRYRGGEAPEVIRMHVNAESGYNANAYVLGRWDFEEGFDNGWDGRFIEGDEEAPQLYMSTTDGKMVINCVPEIDGTVLDFQRGSADAMYTFTFEYEGDKTWYLNDLKEKKSTRISGENNYTFYSENYDSRSRFVISSLPMNTATGVDRTQGDNVAETKARKIMVNGLLYIIRGGQIYDATGAIVK